VDFPIGTRFLRQPTDGNGQCFYVINVIAEDGIHRSQQQMWPFQ
jgi:hypothetical protein